ncbi:MAG: ATP-binding protein [Planctomycetes bacterium]|nr:ATP-binding protein [Planctomycetota bacterium]
MADYLTEFIDSRDEAGPFARSHAFCQMQFESVCGTGEVSSNIPDVDPFETDSEEARPELSEASTSELPHPEAASLLPCKGQEPLARLAQTLRLRRIELDLLMLAGLPEQHEGHAQVMQTLHPHQKPFATTGLAAQLFASTESHRQRLRHVLETGAATSSGLLRIEGDGPFFQRDLRPAAGLWSVLEGSFGWPEELRPVEAVTALEGLSGWLEESALTAFQAIRENVPATVAISDEDEERCFHRGAALVHAAGREPVCFEIACEDTARFARQIQLHAIARNFVPVIRLRCKEQPGDVYVPSFEWLGGTAVVTCRTGIASFRGTRPVLGIACDRMRPAELTAMWREAVPSLASHAGALAARYPVEPAEAHQVAVDLALVEQIQSRSARADDVAQSVRTRTRAAMRGGIRLVQPKAEWEKLVLPPDHARQLSEAVDRLMNQARVLDDWQFLEGRHGARGVRMLFAGPPGTGKTLSAETMARHLNVDLLIVDLSRVVSKWIGETEKNLADVFESAERSRSVLLFDEADSLFGKRTDVSDAHDRYANLETAYLLSRLERFEGLAILSTNLRQNIDQAFTRRLEFILEFEKPDRDQRLALWTCHIPNTDLLAPDVSLAALASQYPLVGGLIRNAAVAAAFLASADAPDSEVDASRGKITQAHFVRAIKREYEKTGQPFPGLPPGLTGI